MLEPDCRKGDNVEPKSKESPQPLLKPDCRKEDMDELKGNETSTLLLRPDCEQEGKDEASKTCSEGSPTTVPRTALSAVLQISTLLRLDTSAQEDCDFQILLLTLDSTEYFRTDGTGKPSARVHRMEVDSRTLMAFIACLRLVC